MSAVNDALVSHLQTGTTHVCRCWALSRKDGTELGFTDHDAVLEFDGIRFEAASGMTASALQSSTGLSVDNAEATGALSHASLTEADIMAGRFDGAQMRVWLVNWSDVTMRQMIFRGHLGELTRAGGAFEAELRGIAEQMNQTRGRLYQGPCTALLGDTACGFDLTQLGFQEEVTVDTITDGRDLLFSTFGSFADGWFARGTIEVLTGAAAGASGLIKSDQIDGDGRRIVLWQEVQADLASGDQIRLTAGCDKRFATCKGKFANTVNFRGFPHIPGEDWLMSYPTRSGENDGGALKALQK